LHTYSYKITGTIMVIDILIFTKRQQVFSEMKDKRR